MAWCVDTRAKRPALHTDVDAEEGRKTCFIVIDVMIYLLVKTFNQETRFWPADLFSKLNNLFLIKFLYKFVYRFGHIYPIL